MSPNLSARHTSPTADTASRERTATAARPAYRPTVRRACSRELIARAQADLASLTMAEMRVLQRGIGNRAVQRLLAAAIDTRGPRPQAKLTASQGDDPAEREADALAKEVAPTCSFAKGLASP